MLLCDDHPMLMDKIIAKKIGLNESIVLQQVHYWLKINEKNKRNFNKMKMDRTLWYSIDYERLNDLIDECKGHITRPLKKSLFCHPERSEGS